MPPFTLTYQHYATRCWTHSGGAADALQKVGETIGLLLLAVLTLMTTGCTGGHGDTARDGAVTDIMQVTERVMTYAAEEPERALEVIDSLRSEGLADYQADLLRVRVYCQGLEGKMLDSAIVIGERLMELPVAKENQEYREDLLETLVYACRLQHDFERVIKWSSELVTLCHEEGEETEALRNEAEIGLYLTHFGRQQEGVSKIDSVLAVLDSSLLRGDKRGWVSNDVPPSGGLRGAFNELDAWTIAAKRKITVLKEAGQTEPIIPVAQSIIARLTDYEQHPDDYHDGTYREPSDDDRQGYIDFYRAQAYGYMAEAYARNGENQKARECLKKFEQSDYCQTLDGRKMIAPTWCLLGETEKMETMYEDLTTARFRDYEQRMEIERQKAEASLWRIITWLVVVIALLLACFGVYYFLRHREETRKNRILARQITEIVKLKAHPSPPKGRDVGLHNSAEASTITGNQTSPPLEGLGEAPSLFAHISQTIVREKLFLDPAFDRQAAIDHFHLSKERIGAAFAQGSDYASISDFINECRLEYAVNLLNDQPALPVSQVAQACGFSDANYFGRKFKERFGLSPSQYRTGNTPKPSCHS